MQVIQALTGGSDLGALELDEGAFGLHVDLGFSPTRPGVKRTRDPRESPPIHFDPLQYRDTGAIIGEDTDDEDIERDNASSGDQDDTRSQEEMRSEGRTAHPEQTERGNVSDNEGIEETVQQLQIGKEKQPHTPTTDNLPVGYNDNYPRLEDVFPLNTWSEIYGGWEMDDAHSAAGRRDLWYALMLAFPSLREKQPAVGANTEDDN
ncbi:hypothetical protein C8Q77DRAFT_755319 [Trametes polyzona]|nr:hypothetical protein C8Q77DRAFT_755319 [Trametes polyzona]